MPTTTATDAAMKRLCLFLLTNLAIVLMLTLVARLSGLDAWLARQGSSLGVLLIAAALFGFCGSLISLALSKTLALRSIGVRIIEAPTTPAEQWLLDTVQRLAHGTGIGVPSVGIFESGQPNAFATGARRDRALVAVSSALLGTMSREQVEAVLGHELSHVANGDMVTLALIQGVVNTFVIFLSRVVGNIVDRSLMRDEDGRGPACIVTVLAMQLLLGVLAMLIVMRFSRQREFRADAGGARLAGREHMIGALECLRRAHPAPLPSQWRAFGIAAARHSGWRILFMSHPPLEERIAALRVAG